MIERMLPPLVAVVVVLVAAYRILMRRDNLPRGEARQLVSAGARLVDVRTPLEFAAGHLVGAVNIPLQQLANRLSELQPKAAAVVVYCRSGQRSGNAARMLKSAGFGAVHDLGPMSRW
ncbi:MAG: rhodanese-like domain-containing protein [Polyangiaceae bacterium]